MFHREQLIGNWHRSEHLENENFSEYAQLFADGTFMFTFYTYNLDGSLIEEISELGDWGLVGDIHFTITKEAVENQQVYAADMEDEDNYQAYKIIKIDANEFSYQHLLSGESFTLSKVLPSANQN
ncbi:hypothetical protein [Thalassotalea sp. ND16A]|uniref:hypothetical protein n=1 Tax=Thalassotalea sp. ND16A TaxID=1535422 RepID=UPI00051A83EB|nr:hypothetical protein [Thalassotalea sp. ND16A]KGK00636.1 hypothetical protein ND16A_3396 [Thalassotalea sp. ND16A]